MFLLQVKGGRREGKQSQAGPGQGPGLGFLSEAGAPAFWVPLPPEHPELPWELPALALPDGFPQPLLPPFLTGLLLIFPAHPGESRNGCVRTDDS